MLLAVTGASIATLLAKIPSTADGGQGAFGLLGDETSSPSYAEIERSELICGGRHPVRGWCWLKRAPTAARTRRDRTDRLRLTSVGELDQGHRTLPRRPGHREQVYPESQVLERRPADFPGAGMRRRLGEVLSSSASPKAERAPRSM